MKKHESDIAIGNIMTTAVQRCKRLLVVSTATLMVATSLTAVPAMANDQVDDAVSSSQTETVTTPSPEVSAIPDEPAPAPEQSSEVSPSQSETIPVPDPTDPASQESATQKDAAAPTAGDSGPWARGGKAMKQKYGDPARLDGKATLAKNGDLKVPLRVHAWRNMKRKSKKERHRAARVDRLKVTLLVTKKLAPIGNTGLSTVSRSSLAQVEKRTVKVTRDGVLTLRFKLRKSLISSLRKTARKKLDRRVLVHVIHQKDTKAGTPGFDTLFVSSVFGGQFKNVAKGGGARKVFKADKDQGRFRDPAPRWSNSSGDLSFTSGGVTYTSNGLTMVNNTPFTQGYTMGGVSCVVGNGVPAVSGDAPESLSPNGQIFVDQFTALTESGNVNSESAIDLFFQSAATATAKAGETAVGEYASSSKEASSFTDSSLSSFNSMTSLEIGAEAGFAFVSSFFQSWTANLCKTDSNSQLWSITTIAQNVPNNVVLGSPQTWNYNGSSNSNGQQLGVNGVMVPSSWGPPPVAETFGEVGSQTSATWSWQNGYPNNGPNPFTSGNNQAGSISNQGNFIQSVNSASGTIYLSYLANDTLEYGPYPAGVTEGGASQMRIVAAPGNQNNPDGVELTCHAGDWDFSSPYGSSGTLASSSNIQDIMATSTSSVSAESGIGYNVLFTAYDPNDNELYGASYTPASGNPGLGPNATAQMVPALIESRASAELSATEVLNLVYADGTPYSGSMPARFGCTITATVSIPQGLTAGGSMQDVSAISSNNYQWQSRPYTVTSGFLYGPQNFVPPTLSADAVEIAVPVTVDNGEWKNAASYSYQWQWCTDSACTSPQTVFPTGTVEGLNTQTFTLTQAGIGGGAYLRAAVTAASATGVKLTEYTNTVMISAPPAVTYASVGCSPQVQPTAGGDCAASVAATGGNNEVTYEWFQASSAYTPGSDPTTYSYTPIGVTTSTLSLSNGSLGLQTGNLLAVEVTVTNDVGSTQKWAYSSLPYNSAVGPNPLTGPSLTQDDAYVGYPISVVSGNWGNPETQVSYQWFTCGMLVGSNCLNPSLLAGQTSATYEIPAGSSGLYLQSLVTGVAQGITITMYTNAVLIGGPAAIASGAQVLSNSGGGCATPVSPGSCYAAVAATGSPAATLTYEWQVSSSLSGPWTTIGTAWTQSIPSEYVGQYLQLVATADNGEGDPATWTWTSTEPIESN